MVFEKRTRNNPALALVQLAAPLIADDSGRWRANVNEVTVSERRDTIRQATYTCNLPEGTNLQKI